MRESSSALQLRHVDDFRSPPIRRWDAASHESRNSGTDTTLGGLFASGLSASSRACRIAWVASAFVLNPEPVLRRRPVLLVPTSIANAQAIWPAQIEPSESSRSHGFLLVAAAVPPHLRHLRQTDPSLRSIESMPFRVLAVGLLLDEVASVLHRFHPID